MHRVVPELPFIKVCNYVCTLHDLMYRFHLKNDKKKEIKLKHKLKAIGYGIILKKSLANARHILVPSFSIKKEVVEVLRINPEKIEVTHEGIQKIEVRKPVLNGHDVFRILVVAGFYPHKGHAKVLELARVLINNGIKNFTITFQGNPFYVNILTSIKEAIKKYQLEEHIFIHDFKREHNVEKMYASYDCFLLLSEYEGFGLPVLEAQMSGLPVICSEIEVFKEVLLDSAVFVNTRDIQNSCNKVIELMHDKEARNALIEKGFNNCKRFSWSKMAKETMRAYSKC